MGHASTCAANNGGADLRKAVGLEEGSFRRRVLHRHASRIGGHGPGRCLGGRDAAPSPQGPTRDPPADRVPVGGLPQWLRGGGSNTIVGGRKWSRRCNHATRRGRGKTRYDGVRRGDGQRGRGRAAKATIRPGGAISKLRGPRGRSRSRRSSRAKEIRKRFATGAMSSGSSAAGKAHHETLRDRGERLGRQVEHRRRRGGTRSEISQARPERRKTCAARRSKEVGLRRFGVTIRLPGQRPRAVQIKMGAGARSRGTPRGGASLGAQGRRIHRPTSATRRRVWALISPPPHHDSITIEGPKS